MNYIFRGASWIKELTVTLLKFWIKNPQETPAVLKFVGEKLIASPRFLIKNILTEKQSESYEQILKKTVEIYNQHGSKFDPSDTKSYKALEDVLESKSQLLYFLVRKLKPGKIMETGVASGESTGFILQAIKDNRSGHLYSVDLPFQWYVYGNHTLHLDSLPSGQLPGYLVPEKLKRNWTLVLGDTYEKLPELLKSLKSIDIFLHDSEHTDKTMTFEFEQSWPLIKKGGLLLSDDVSYTKAFDKFVKDRQLKNLIFKDLGVAIKN